MYNKVIKIKGEIRMKNKKYKLTNISMRYEGRTLYRIRALKDFLNVEKGDLGGW